VIAGSALRQIPGSKAESKCWMARRPTLAAIGQVSLPQAPVFLERQPPHALFGLF
jgi:hypothetical protein